MQYAAIDMRHLLLENYKKLGITETELVVLIMIEHLLKQSLIVSFQVDKN